MRDKIRRHAAPAAAAVTLVVGFAWGTAALGCGPRASLAAGLVFAASVYLALRSAVRRAGRAPDRERRLARLLVLAGCLMCLAGLLALLVPDAGRARLLATVAFVTAAVYFGAGLFQHLSGRGKTPGT